MNKRIFCSRIIEINELIWEMQNKFTNYLNTKNCFCNKSKFQSANCQKIYCPIKYF